MQGYGYDVIGADVWTAYRSTMKAAEKSANAAAVRGQIKEIVGNAKPNSFVPQILAHELGL